MNKSPTHMSKLNTLHIQPAIIGGPSVRRGPNKYSGEPLTQEIINDIREGRPFKMGFGTHSAIHRSPRGNDCWYCEHQFNVEYIFHEEVGNRIYPSIDWTDTTRKKCEWYLDTSNMTLVVLATHIYGNKLEIYATNEFGIFLKDAPNYPEDEVHDGFNDISPPPPQEMTLMDYTSPDYVD